jgi:murein DD-endopeptidase MepM/ murein hydrolase activator NlpD
MSTRVTVTAVLAIISTAAMDATPLSFQVAPLSPRPAALSLAVSHRAKVIVPGDVVLVNVVPSARATTVEGTAFDQHVTFWRSDTGTTWRGLVGIPLDTPQGSQELLVQATDPSGAVVTSRLALRVHDKQFATRRLTVDPRFVDPPANEVERILREQALLNETFVTVTERLWRGAFVPPVPARPNSSFGRLTVFNNEPRGRHQGADYAVGTGTPVRAPNAGRIVIADDLYFSGNTIVLDHGGGLFSLFAHLSRMTLPRGAVVTKGDKVGEVGATGRVTGPHLHWAVRLGDVSVDPQSLIAAAASLTETAVAAPRR